MALAGFVEEPDVAARSGIPRALIPFASLQARVSGVSDQALKRVVNLLLFLGREAGVTADEMGVEPEFHRLF